MPRKFYTQTFKKKWVDKTSGKALVKHGRHIFMFRNISTNQVLYSFYPGLDDSHIKQLPFIGKHSVPPTIRHDLWKPYCTVTFPTTHQGLVAYRKLREFRKLHETCWDPSELRKLQETRWGRNDKVALTNSRKSRILMIMDQKANAVADLAQVLITQGLQGEWMKKRKEERLQAQLDFVKERWAEIDGLANAVDQGEVQRLEDEIDSLKQQVSRKSNEKEKERLNKAMSLHRRRIKKLLWAHRQATARNTAQKSLEKIENKKNAPAEISPLENRVTRSVLPKALQKPVAEPFTLNGITVEWADLYDAEYAEKWPEGVTHSSMGIVARTPPLPGKEKNEFPLTEPEIEAKLAAEEAARERALKAQERAERDAADGITREKKKTGVWQYLPSIPNPLSRFTSKSV
ncbi:hypothetical protein K469DRAFT_637508 [Zopfia rhizophila CBS 207.26]|uniref:Large ribosomal subunit protein mL67 n=1 Tax=Zopfia rhizophila CBS 207.26 TaxID=1314779 RepID=A0A6A6DSL3_9PEZI|nr:hypothetical protein K469DRAFT_637508 [Zopfia rhizophila CBS 207.26]